MQETKNGLRMKTKAWFEIKSTVVGLETYFDNLDETKYVHLHNETLMQWTFIEKIIFETCLLVKPLGKHAVIREYILISQNVLLGHCE